VVIFCGFLVYYPEFSQRFTKNSRPVGAYAFPIMAIGTIFLMVGMLICPAVVEQSTTEKEYVLRLPKDSKIETSTRDQNAGADNKLNLRLLWLQKSETINDQAFDSFLLLGQSSGRRHHILTSRRYVSQTSRPISASIGGKLRMIASNSTEIFTLLGVFFGLSGFNLQFEVSLEVLAEGITYQFRTLYIRQGLRSMHWSASISQLVCIL